MPRGWPQFGGAGGGGVVTDSTLTGSGTVASPLSVATNVRGSVIPGFNYLSVLNPTAGFRSTANATTMFGIPLPGLSLDQGIVIDINTADAIGLYDFGIYNGSGVLVIHTGAIHLPSTGLTSLPWTGTLPVTLAAGMYYLAYTGNANTAIWYGASNNPGNPICPALVNSATGGTTSGGALNASGLTPPTYNPTFFGYPYFALF